MKGAIIYKGKYGATKQYAEWLGAEFSLPIIKADDLIKDELERYDFILLGTSIYAGKFQIANWVKRKAKDLIKKKIFLFIVNATEPNDAEKRNKFILDNVPQQIKSCCEIFFLPGRIIHKTLSFGDKLLLKFAGAFEKDPVKKRALNEDINGVKKENLLPLVSAVKNYTGKIVVL